MYFVYRVLWRVFEGDLFLVVFVFGKLKFKNGIKNRILKEIGIDVWNWFKCLEGEILWDKFLKVFEYVEESLGKEFFKFFVEVGVIWVKVKGVEEEFYIGKFYDFMMIIENFFFNGVVFYNCIYYRIDSIYVSNIGIEVVKEYII